MFDDFEIIHAYTRKEAIEDGTLIDVSKMAKEAGFKWPVAVTRAVWGQYVQVPSSARGTGQDVNGRLWDILTMLMSFIRQSKGKGTEIYFTVLVLNSQSKKSLASLKAVSGPDDEGSPCITVMMPDED